MTTNWSPATRTSISCGVSESDRRRAMATSTASPILCPSVSLMWRKLSRSSEIRAKEPPCCLISCSLRSMVSVSCSRFPRPVRSSVSALLRQRSARTTLWLMPSSIQPASSAPIMFSISKGKTASLSARVRWGSGNSMIVPSDSCSRAPNTRKRQDGPQLRRASNCRQARPISGAMSSVRQPI